MEKFRLWLIAAAVAFLVLTGVALGVYGGLPYWPALSTEFGASLAAFVLALQWESHRAGAALARAAKEANELRETEARKRLLALESELKRNKKSIDDLSAKLPTAPTGAVNEFLHPELLDGVWATSGERLGDLLADYDLVASLAVFYGRLEELRWRIRHRTAARDSYLDGMIHALAVEMQEEVDEALARVSKEAENPEVRRVGVVHSGVSTMNIRVAGQVSAARTVEPKRAE
jgi:hypothetical protein